MPKVLRVLNRFNLGGPVYNACYLSADLSPDFETLLVGGPPEEGEFSAAYIADDLGVNYSVIPSMKRAISLKNDRQAYLEIRQLIRTFEPDIVHTHASKAGLIGRLAAIKEGVPVILHTFHGHVFHSYFGALKTGLFKQLERFLARKSSAVVTISKHQRYELVEQFKIIPPSKARIVPLGFDLTRFQKDHGVRRIDFRKRFNLQEDTVAIGIVGRFAPIKNHTFFVDILSQLQHDNWIAFFVGDGDERPVIEEHLRNRGISFAKKESYAGEQVCMLSWVTNVALLLPGLDVVALTSHNEGTPVSLIEAQAAAVPVISTKVGGVEDVVLDGETGLLFAPNDLNGYAEGLDKLISAPSFRSKLGAAGVTHAFNHFTRERLAKDMISLYKELI